MKDEVNVWQPVKKMVLRMRVRVRPLEVTIAAVCLGGLVGGGAQAAQWPVPFRVQAIDTNETGRYIIMQSSPTFGKVADEAKGPRLAHAIPLMPVSECRWGTFTSVAFLGPPPKACRRGERIDGRVHNGYAVVNVRTSEKTLVEVHYPYTFRETRANATRIGPFTACIPLAVGSFACSAEEFTAVEVHRNASSVWIVHPVIESQGILLQLFGLGLVVLFALTAAQRNFSYASANLKYLRAASADAAFAAASTMVLLLAHGRSIIGLDVEVGQDFAEMFETAFMAWSLTLASIGWLMTAAQMMTADKGAARGPKPTTAVVPLQSIQKEILEVPMLASLTIIWPMASGPHFLMQLQFLCGTAISFISGRAGGVISVVDGRHAALIAAAVVLGGLLSGTILSLATVAESGAVTRGLPSLMFTAVLQLQSAAVGALWAAPIYVKLRDAPPQPQTGQMHPTAGNLISFT